MDKYFDSGMEFFGSERDDRDWLDFESHKMHIEEQRERAKKQREVLAYISKRVLEQGASL